MPGARCGVNQRPRCTISARTRRTREGRAGCRCLCYGCSLSPLAHYFTHSTFHPPWTAGARIYLARGSPALRSQAAHPLRLVLHHHPVFVASPSAPVPFAAVKTLCNRRSLRPAAPLWQKCGSSSILLIPCILVRSPSLVLRLRISSLPSPCPRNPSRHATSYLTPSIPRLDHLRVPFRVLPFPLCHPSLTLHSLLPTSYLGPPDVATGLLCI